MLTMATATPRTKVNPRTRTAHRATTTSMASHNEARGTTVSTMHQQDGLQDNFRKKGGTPPLTPRWKGQRVEISQRQQLKRWRRKGQRSGVGDEGGKAFLAFLQTSWAIELRPWRAPGGRIEDAGGVPELVPVLGEVRAEDGASIAEHRSSS